MSNIGAMMEAIDKWTPKSEADLFRICKEHKDNLAGAFDQNGWTLLHTAVYKEIDFILSKPYAGNLRCTIRIESSFRRILV